MTEEAVHGLLYLPEVVHRQVQLSSSAPENQLLRSEFYYEQVGGTPVALGGARIAPNDLESL